MEELVKVFDGVMLKSTRDDLRSFIYNNNARKFIIYSDYCFDKSKSNSVASFTIVPYDVGIDYEAQYIKKIAPNDIKNTTKVNELFVRHLKSKRLFHINFIFVDLAGLTENLELFGTKYVVKSIEHTIEIIRGWLKNQPEGKEKFNQLLKKLKSLKSEASRKTFNLDLYRKIIIVSFLAAYIAYLLTKEAEAEIVAWFSDRDKITEAYKGIAFDYFDLNHHGLCERDNLKSTKTQLGIGAPVNDDTGNLWYDDLNRMPDYLAGALASWDLKNNTISHIKYTSILRECFANSQSNSIIKVDIKSNGYSCVRLSISPAP